MTVLGTGISWTNSTLNPWVGCKKVSAGCDNCYARVLVNGPRGGHFGHPFEEVKLHLNRLDQVRKFKPIVGKDGTKTPHMVFVNSMSDFFLEDVPDSAIYAALDVIEAAPDTVFQILSKRPIRARKIIVDRFGNRGVPEHIWFGFSVEDNPVAGRVNILRKIKERVGDMTAFLSVEPIIGSTNEIDMTGIDWVITGGESGGHARTMLRSDLIEAITGGLNRGAAVYHKQNGTTWSHPNLDRAPQRLGITAKFDWLVANGWELLPDEKGGATIDKQTYRQFPPAFGRITARLNATLI